MRPRAALAALTLAPALAASACSAAPPAATPTAPPAAGAEATPYLTPSPPPANVSDVPASVAVEVDGARAAWIGPRGGTLTAVGVDGTEYVLTVPELAVSEPTAITMAPVGAVNDLALSGGLAGAVWLQPTGLALTAPATLSIKPKRAPPEGMRLSGFDIAGDGDLVLTPHRADGTGIAVTVFHFSAAGAGWGTSADLQGLGSTAPTGRLAGLMNRFLTYEVPWGQLDQATAFGLLLGLWDNLLKAELEGVASDSELRKALADWRQFIFLSNLLSTRGDIDAALALGLELGTFPIGFESLRLIDVAGRTMIGTRIAEAIAGNRTLCTEGHDLGALANMWYWAGAGERYAPGEQEWASAAEGCAGVVISVANLPTTLAQGGTDTVRLQFALRFEDGVQVPADVDATVHAGGFEFFPGGAADLSRAVAAETVLTFGITALAPAPYSIGVDMCWVLGGLPRPLCDQDSRQFGTAATTPPPTQTSGPTPPSAEIGGFYDGTGTFTQLDNSRTSPERWFVHGHSGATVIALIPATPGSPVVPICGGGCIPGIKYSGGSFSLSEPGFTLSGSVGGGILTFTMTWSEQCPPSISNDFNPCSRSFSGSLNPNP